MSRLLLISFIITVVIFATSREVHGKCGKNQVASNCANACNGSCEHPDPGLCMINPQYCERGCKCKEGYVKDSYSGECVALEDCPEPQKKPHHNKPKH